MSSQICFLIDDDEDDREIFALALENANTDYSCITAKNGIDAMEKINSAAVFAADFIFIDLNMPYMSGRECLEQIRNNPKTAGIPVIMYTTSSYSKDVEETKALGATYFLVKPPSLGALTTALKNILHGTTLPFYLNA